MANLLNDNKKPAILPFLPILLGVMVTMIASPPVGQSRLMSLAEATTNVVVGFLLALLTQCAIFPLFGLSVSVADNLLISSIFTTVSLFRSYALRRLFETMRASRSE